MGLNLSRQMNCTWFFEKLEVANWQEKLHMSAKIDNLNEKMLVKVVDYKNI